MPRPTNLRPTFRAYAHISTTVPHIRMLWSLTFTLYLAFLSTKPEADVTATRRLFEDESTDRMRVS